MPLYGDGRSGTFSATVTQYGGYQTPSAPPTAPSQGPSRLISQPPAPVVLSNALEGTSGTAVSITNSGGPDQFDVVNVSGTGSTHTYDSARAHSGTTSAKMTLAAGVASTAYVRWNQTHLTAAGVGTLYCRFYIYLTAYPTATPTRLVNGSNGANHTGNLQLLTDGTLRLFDSGGTAIATSTATVPLNQWVRIDLEHTNTVGTTADVVARMFSGANLETFTPDTGATLTGAGMSTGGPIQQISFGPNGTVTQTAAWTVWVDDVAVSTVAAPGGIAGGSTAATATGGITLDGAATGQAGATTTGAITLAGAVTAQVAATATGAITLGGTSSATAPATAAGTISLGGTVTARAATTAAGSVTLVGTTVAAAAATAAGSLILSGTATPTGQATPATAAGAVSLAGSATARASVTAAGLIVLSGTASASVSASSSGVVALGGTATARVPATALGLLTLSGLANAQAATTLPTTHRQYTARPSATRRFAAAGASAACAVTTPPDRAANADGTSRRHTAAGTSRTLSANPTE